MPSTQHLRQNIATVTSIRKITSAMKVVSASSLRRAQHAAENAVPYVEGVQQVLETLLPAIVPEDYPLFAGRSMVRKKIYLIATSERGLCGSFNSQLLKMARQTIGDAIAQDDDVTILFLGKKGYDYFKRYYPEKTHMVPDMWAGKELDYERFRDVAQNLLDQFDAGDVDEIHILYNQFWSAMMQIPRKQTLVPFAGFLPFDDGGKTNKHEKVLPLRDILAEPKAEIMFPKIVRQAVTAHFFGILLENKASELAARMVAMDNATRNSTELLNKLKLYYNRLRQSNITKEIIEIISGAEAL